MPEEPIDDERLKKIQNIPSAKIEFDADRRKIKHNIENDRILDAEFLEEKSDSGDV